MTTLFIRHLVSDYSKWRQIYDDFDATRKTLGVQAHSVYRATDNPNDITVTHEFASADAAHAFGTSPELSAAMHDAGVQGAPTVWFATRS